MSDKRSVMTIVIDGPVGAGKSTIAKSVSDKLGCVHLDTGAMYRAVGFYALLKGVDTQNEADVTKLLQDIHLEVLFHKGLQETRLNGQDITSDIRRPEVSIAASNVSKWLAVRAEMVRIQRKIAENIPIVADGRDMGTVVFPNASVKIFLTASVHERASRRHRELLRAGSNVSFENVLDDMILRDTQDSTRQIDPLVKARDAVQVDTTGLNIPQVVDIILKIAEAAGCEKS
ncbi:MAG: (d)CMP kinase [Clostridia bacterium]|nr:(d)CMP kinase [Clostridia bacterium]